METTTAAPLIVPAKIIKTSVEIEGGRVLRLRVKRFTVGDRVQTSRGFARISEDEETRVLLLRKLPDEFERVQTDDGADRYRVPDDEVMRRRRAELSQVQLRELRAAQDEHERFAAEE